MMGLLFVQPIYALEGQEVIEAESIEDTRENQFGTAQNTFLPLDVNSYEINREAIGEDNVEMNGSVIPILPLENEHSTLPTTQLIQLSEIEQSYTTVGEWLEAQAAIEITNIKLTPTETGIEVILETATGQIPVPTPSTIGNAVIVDIPNAVLADEFEQVNPIEGIARISAENLPGNRVRVAITGTEAAPTAEVRTEAQALVVNVTPGTIATEETVEDAIQILVTAEKAPEDPLDVPISLTVLPEQQIEDAQINTIRNVAANTPNFFTTVGDRVFNFYSIRGISNSNFLIRDSVGFYVDDVPIEYFHQLFPGELFDLERVEVLRGPQNTLYGRNSIAGVVNIISRPPSESLETQLAAEYGTYNQRRIQASISDTLIPETLGLRLSGLIAPAMVLLKILCSMKQQMINRTLPGE